MVSVDEARWWNQLLSYLLEGAKDWLLKTLGASVFFFLVNIDTSPTGRSNSLFFLLLSFSLICRTYDERILLLAIILLN